MGRARRPAAPALRLDREPSPRSRGSRPRRVAGAQLLNRAPCPVPHPAHSHVHSWLADMRRTSANGPRAGHGQASGRTIDSTRDWPDVASADEKLTGAHLTAQSGHCHAASSPSVRTISSCSRRSSQRGHRVIGNTILPRRGGADGWSVAPPDRIRNCDCCGFALFSAAVARPNACRAHWPPGSAKRAARASIGACRDACRCPNCRHHRDGSPWRRS